MPPIRARESTLDSNLRPASCLEPAILVSALVQLERELTTPLERLRSNLIEKLAEAPGPSLAGLAETCHPETLVDLCDDLIRMTRVFFDDSAVRQQAVVPEPGSGLHLSTLIDEIDRQFAAESVDRELGWECRLEGPDTRLPADPFWTRQAVGRTLSEILALACPGVTVSVIGHSDQAEATLRITPFDPSHGLETSEPEHCSLRFARGLLTRLGGDLVVCSESSSLLLRLPTAP